jgi:hypothetical protein
MEHNKNQLIPINNSLASFERQIAIGEKLLGIKLSDFEKNQIKKFIIETVANNYDIINIISLYFPLTEELIEKFKYKLNWGCLCGNKFVFWSEELIDKYFEFIDWESISKNANLNWNERLLYKYSDYLNFNTVFFNDTPNLKLTFNLYEKFKNKIDIENLEYFDFEFPKEFITDNIDIINWENLKSYTVENLELFEDKINWDDLSRSEKLTLTDQLIERFKYRWSWDEIIKIERKNGVPTYIRIFEINFFDEICTNIYYDTGNVIDEEFLDALIEHSSVWSHLSRDINIKNNYSLIEKFEKKWDWTLLTSNNSIEWTSELIEKYKNKIDWEVFSLNPSVQWSEDLIELYHDYWDWKTLGMNIFLPWTADFYKKYENKFQLDFLFFYKEFNTNSNDFFKCNNMISWYFVNHHFHQNIPKIIFDENLIFYVKDILDWDYFSRFYEWSPIEIEKYKEYINWDKLSGNRNIIWSVELLKKYENKWDWGLEYGISWNKCVEDFDLSLLTTYINYLKENDQISDRYPWIKIRNLFLKYIDKNDVIEILDNLRSNQTLNLSNNE